MYNLNWVKCLSVKVTLPISVASSSEIEQRILTLLKVLLLLISSDLTSHFAADVEVHSWVCQFTKASMLGKIEHAANHTKPLPSVMVGVLRVKTGLELSMRVGRETLLW